MDAGANLGHRGVRRRGADLPAAPVRAVNLDDHGYSALHVTDAQVQMEWYAISGRRDPDADSRHLASWSVESGTARVQAVGHTAIA